MNLTFRGKGLAWICVSAWTVALITASMAALAAGVASALALAVAVLSLPRVRAEADREVGQTRCHEGDAVEEVLRVRLVAGRRARAFVRECASPGLAPADGVGAEPADAPVWLRKGRPVERRLAWRAQAWGPESLGPVELRLHDPLHLVEHRQVIGDTTPLRILPRSETLGRFKAGARRPEVALGSYQVSKPGDGSEFYALREYQPGDSIRRINWKASARAGNTMVNQVSQESFARVLVIVDLREKEGAGEPLAARVFSGRAMASIVTHHERLKDSLRVVVLGERATDLSTGVNPRAEQLIELLSGRSCEGRGRLSEMLPFIVPMVRPRAPIYVLTSAALDPDLTQFLGALVALEGQVKMISPAPGIDHETVTSSRDVALREVRGVGVTVWEWARDKPLEGALHAA